MFKTYKDCIIDITCRFILIVAVAVVLVLSIVVFVAAVVVVYNYITYTVFNISEKSLIGVIGWYTKLVRTLLFVTL